MHILPSIALISNVDCLQMKTAATAGNKMEMRKYVSVYCFTYLFVLAMDALCCFSNRCFG